MTVDVAKLSEVDNAFSGGALDLAPPAEKWEEFTEDVMFVLGLARQVPELLDDLASLRADNTRLTKIVHTLRNSPTGAAVAAETERCIQAARGVAGWGAGADILEEAIRATPVKP